MSGTIFTSLEEPHPKFFPLMIMGYGVFISPSSTACVNINAVLNLLTIFDGILICGQANKCVFSQFLIFINLHFISFFNSTPGYATTFDGTKVKYEAGMIWSVSMLSFVTKHFPRYIPGLLLYLGSSCILGSFSVIDADVRTELLFQICL